MDDIVKQAMAKWPNVPDCYGWLGLDARGNWYMRDDAAQHQGYFGGSNPGAKGSLLRHEKLIEFIQRNYAVDDSQQWYFQNGPQRVYVELQTTPWIWRINHNGEVNSHTGITAVVQRAIVDEHGWLYLLTTLGFGLVHTQDVSCAAQVLESGKWTMDDAMRQSLPEQYGYVMSPQQRKQGE
jgi:hypothetical protein